MNKEAILHRNMENFVYPISRNQLTFRIRTAKKEVKSCRIIYRNRNSDIIKEQPMECYARDTLYDYFQCTIRFQKIARYQKYYFSLEDNQGIKIYVSAHGISKVPPTNGFFEYLYTNGNDVVTFPDWAQGAIYYQIFPERFFNGNPDNDPENLSAWGTSPTRGNYMGGDLAGIRKKIPYLKELGIECLYLNPIFKGDFNHKYATTDYFKIDPIFGTNEEFRALVKQCHSQSIRIILDGVFNHTGINFPFFQDILEKQEHSTYKNWFLIEKYPVTISADSYECVGAYPYMPKLNTANPEVRNYILRIMEHWIKEYEIDGWRLDVADEVDYFLWEMARITLKPKYPECILIGETWGFGDKLLKGDQLDSIMNYRFRDAIWDYFGTKSITAETFDYRINTILAWYKNETCQLMYNLLDSHDTERFLHICNENKEILKLAAAFQMLFIGAPAIYYGDEVGITGENDPDCRRCMIWDEQADLSLLKWYKKIIFLRKTYPSIRKGKYKTIFADNKSNIFAFIRYCENDNSPEKIYAIFNNNSKPEDILLPVLEDGIYTDLLSEKREQYITTSLEGKFYNQDITAYRAVISTTMPPYAVKVIIKNGGK